MAHHDPAPGDDKTGDPPSQLLAQALVHHQAGRLAAAEQGYRRLLALIPGHGGALQGLGVIACQRGAYAAAVPLLEQAIEDRPLDPDLLAVLGSALRHAGRLEEAIAAFERAAALAPPSPELLLSLGSALRTAGRLDAAAAAFGRALTLRSQSVEALRGLGDALYALGHPVEAAAAFRQALETRPDDPDALFGLAAACLDLAQAAEAESLCRQGLALRPGDARALTGLGVALAQQDRHLEAIAAFEQAIAVSPDAPEAHRRLAASRLAVGAIAEAVANAEAAVALLTGRDDPQAPAALRCDCQPVSGSSASANANASAEGPPGIGGDASWNPSSPAGPLPEPALPAGGQSHKTTQAAAAWVTLGNALRAAGRLGAAIAAYRDALARCPDDIDAEWNLALALLTEGTYQEGWTRFEARWRHPRLPCRGRGFSAPRWEGEPLDGRTILLHAEPGLGDTLQCLRYAPLVAALGGRVVLEVPYPLVRLVSGAMPGAVESGPAGGVVQVVAAGAPLPPFACHCPLMSLPRVFRTGVTPIPDAVPYLSVPPAATEAWRSRLTELAARADSAHLERVRERVLPGRGRRRFGLTWAGSRACPNDRQRSLTLDLLAPLWACSGVCWFSLQKDLRPAERSQLDALADAGTLVDLEAELGDFADTAAALTALDGIVCVDTAIAHLAGALARPALLLLPYAPDWRWQRERTDSPWYRTLRLFRQPAPNTWSPTITAVAAAAAELAAGDNLNAPGEPS